MKYLLTLIFVTISFSCFAGNSSGKVVRIMVHHGDVVIFDIGAHNDKPDCSTVNNDWALSLSSEKGRAMYALLLSAAAQGQTVSVHGEGVCNAWADRESPKYMYVNYN